MLAVFGLVACGDEPDSPEARVKAYLARGEVAAEARDLQGLRAMISPAYRDDLGRDRRAVVRLLAGYFLRHRSIHLLTRVEHVAFAEETRAQVVVYVAMAARPMTDAHALLSLRADLYRFELALVEQAGEWQLTSVTWRPAEQADFIDFGQVKGLLEQWA